MVESGKMGDDERLPPIRKLSKELNVNTSTVINAYKLLESNGYAYSRLGSGTYIRSKGKRNSGSVIEEFIQKKSDVDSLDKAQGRHFIDFTISTPDPSLFPAWEFKKIMDHVMDRDGGHAFGYTDVKGYMPLRESIAEYMGKSGVCFGCDDVYIISGAQQGIDIISKVLIDFGDIIITEKPTYTGAIAVFKSRGAKIIDVPINQEGIDIDKVENLLHEIKPKFMYMMTNFQNPTGFSYSSKVMERLLRIAEQYNFYIIEDDYLSELYYSDQNPVTLKSMDKYDRVIYIKSFSKTFMPGARLGFIIVPKKLQDRVLSVKHFSDISSSGFMQRVFDMFIRSNLIEKYITDIKLEYQQRYSAATGFLDRMEGISYFKPKGGIHLWIRLPENVSSNVLYGECLYHNVKISPGSVFFIDAMDSEYIRLSYASLKVDEILKGMEVLDRTIKKIRNNSMYLNRPLIL